MDGRRIAFRPQANRALHGMGLEACGSQCSSCFKESIRSERMMLRTKRLALSNW